MGWFKLDDTLTVADQPLSAFLGYGLTRNVNSYPSELRRFVTFGYPTTPDGKAKVMWASYWQPRGTIFTVDCGINATDFVFNVFYRTESESLGGKLYVRHADSGSQVEVACSATLTPTSIEIPYTTTQPLSGLQVFFVGFKSEVGEESIGAVELVGATGNQVFADPATGNPFPYTLATGYHEMWHLLKIDPTTTRPAPSARSLLNYQINAFQHNVNPERPPHGVLLIWPEIEMQPAILPTNITPVGGTKMTANIFELGRLHLYSISVEVERATDQGLQQPYAYQQATAINALNNQINASMMQLQPDAGSLMSTDGFLGCVLPAGQEATFAFLVQNKQVVLTLNVSFECITYNGDQDTNPDITFGVRAGDTSVIGTDITYTGVSVPRFSAQPTRNSTDTSMVAMNGVLAGDSKWGMRDSMTLSEADKATPVRFTWGPNVEGDFDSGVVYYGTISATTDLYIFGFNCRVL